MQIHNITMFAHDLPKYIHYSSSMAISLSMYYSVYGFHIAETAWLLKAIKCNSTLSAPPTICQKSLAINMRNANRIVWYGAYLHHHHHHHHHLEESHQIRFQFICIMWFVRNLLLCAEIRFAWHSLYFLCWSTSGISDPLRLHSFKTESYLYAFA